MPRVPNSYFIQDDVVFLARDIIGKVLVSKIKGKVTSGIISETEAYNGVNDKACHAFGGRRSERTKIMYGRGGCAYVYFCYGMHHLFNIVTSVEGDPKAILIRGIIPLDGTDIILKRRNASKITGNLCSGPGKVTQALGIETKLCGISLEQNKIWVEDRGIKINKKKITSGPRIGVDYAGKDALLPYRFLLKDL